MPSETKEEIRKLILSLLVTRPNYVPLAVLDNDYYDIERSRIPWNRFGFGSLLEFLQSMPQYFQVIHINGINHVRGIADKSKHISSLVARQKKTSKHSFSRPRSSYHISHSRPKIPAEVLHNLVQHVKNSPNGITINKALLILQNNLPHITLSAKDLQDQLRELRHQLYLSNNIIYSVMRSASVPQVSTSKYCQPSLAALEPSVNIPGPSSSNVVYTVPEECSDIMLDENEDGFVRPDSAHKYSNYENTVSYHNYKAHNQEEYNNNNNTVYSTNMSMSESESNNLSNLISHRMQSRLKQLVQKYPDGILCSELPNLYMKEFQMPLNYAELGFNSVCTFVSYLPDIFYLTRLDTNDDFIVYSVDKKPNEKDVTGNDQGTFRSSTQKTTKPINIPNSQFELNDVNIENAPFPLDLSPDALDKFAPTDVTTFDSVSHILVTDLQQDKKQYLEVYIVEVFTPSFFWIQLRKNVKHFDLFMENLHKFYQQNYERYTIPKLALKRGLNCACIYSKVWHRGVIKSVKPDFKVTVMFYDYGTQKTYTSDDVFYLTKEFSHLPAQAIPCSLYNVKPYTGDRWRKSITDRFIDRICETLLAATVVSVDPMNNSMLIILTDTSEEIDVRINDWLVQENLARHGKMGNSVDMASLTKYVLNSANRIPSYCFAEENPVTDSCSKSTTTEEFTESSSVSFGPSFACRDNNEQSRSIPPSFVPINEYSDRPQSRHCVYPTLGNVPSTAPSLLSDLTEEVANSPFLDGNSKSSVVNVTSDILSYNTEEQMFAQFMQENTSLQMQLTNSFLTLLKFPPVTKSTCLKYITLLFQFNNALRILMKELNNQLMNILPSRNCENDIGLLSKTSQYNPNCESSVNQGAASSSRPPQSSSKIPSTTANSIGECNKQYHHAADMGFPTSDMKGFSYSSQHRVHAHNPHISHVQAHAYNLEQAANQVPVSSHQVDINNSYVHERPFSITPCSVDPESSVFNRHENVIKDTSTLENIPSTKTPSSFSDLSKSDVTNNHFLGVNSKSFVPNSTSFPAMSDVPFNDSKKQMLEKHQDYVKELFQKSPLNVEIASHTDTSNINAHSFHYNTNKFVDAYVQHGNIYKDEESTKWKETNPFIFYQEVEKRVLAEQNVHNHFDVTNFASHLPNNQSHTSNENANFRTTDYDFYRTCEGNTARNESNVDSMSTEYNMYSGDTKANNYAPRIVYEAGPVMYNLQKEQSKEQQLPSQPATQLQSNIVNNNVDHIIPSSSSNDMSILNDEGYVTPSTQTNNSPPITNAENHNQLGTNVLEAWTSLMIQNNPLQNYSENSVSATMCSPSSLSPYNIWNYETNTKFKTGDSHKTAGPSGTSLSDDNEGAITSTCTAFGNLSLSKDKKETIPCNCNTSLNTSFLFQQLDSVDGVTILFHLNEDGWILMSEFMEAFSKFSKSCRIETTISLKKVHRYEYPVQFLQLDSYPLNIVRDSKNRIIFLNLISLQAALGLLCNLKLISHEEIENTIKGNKTFINNPVMFNMRELIIKYKDFRHRIEQCNADYGM